MPDEKDRSDFGFVNRFGDDGRSAKERMAPTVERSVGERSVIISVTPELVQAMEAFHASPENQFTDLPAEM